MPAPRVFVSSTFYDLRYIRENLKYFIKSLGYDPVLSEEGSVYYAPRAHVHEAAVAEVPSCQMLILIIGGRYGQGYRPEPDQSVTNAEYKKAVEAKVPIFALVERDVYAQYRVYRENKQNADIDAASINYPAVDTVRVFEFVEEVQDQAVNNALVPFADFEEIQNYLRQQWASMMFSFVSSESEAHRVADTLAAVTEVSRKIEFLSREVLKAVGDRFTTAAVEMYDVLLGADVVRDLAIGGARPTPEVIVRHETLDQYFASADVDLQVMDDSSDISSQVSKGRVSLAREYYESMKKRYVGVRSELLRKLDEHGLSVEDYLGSETKKREDIRP